LADYLTIDELALYLRTTERAIRRWRERGTCPPAARVGARLLFERSDIDAWVTSRREESAPNPFPPLRGDRSAYQRRALPGGSALRDPYNPQDRLAVAMPESPHKRRRGGLRSTSSNQHPGGREGGAAPTSRGVA
jgi:excisionase family DNA binding protein